MQKKDKLVLGIGLFAMVLTIIIGTSYAYWKLSKVQEDRNIIATGCFNVEFTDGDGIDLQSAFPISDEDGLKLTPYTFTIENKCDSYVSYQINLETLQQETGVKVLPDEYVRVDLQEGTSRKKNSILNSDIETETTLTEAVKAYKLYTKYLKPNQSKTYNLRIWMDKDTEPLEETMNAFYSGKIAIDFSYIKESPTKPINAVKIGDYISMTPTSTSYTPPSELTGCLNDSGCTQNELNPGELNLWRVIKINEDGTVEAVSEYVSSTKVYFRGETGYKNLVGGLNEIAAQYTNEKYVQSTRHMGYSNQTPSCEGTLSFGDETTCPADTGYETDTNLVQTATGIKIIKTPPVKNEAGEITSGNTEAQYWLASRNVTANSYFTYYIGRCVLTNGNISNGYLDIVGISGNTNNLSEQYAVRPIVTLKSEVEIGGGEGTSESPYTLN